MGELKSRPVRNGNVLYEVGLAHALRLPDEVALFRSDGDELLFDIMNVRVLHYDPDGDPDSAQNLVVETIVQSLKELDQRRSLSVRRAAEALDEDCWMVLFTAVAEGAIQFPPNRTFGHVLAGAQRRQTISRLLALGALRAELFRLTPESVNDPVDQQFAKYSVTEFGHALSEHAAKHMGFNRPDVQQLLASMATQDERPSA